MIIVGANTLPRGRWDADRVVVARYTPNPNLQRFQGDLAGITFRRDGTALPTVKPRDPKTPRQRESRRRVEIVSEAWGLVSPEGAGEWRTYAELVAAAGVRSETGRPLRAYDLFNGLGLKYLQIHGGAEVPLAAPGRLFLGDAVAVEAEGIEEAVRFRANGPNGPLALTECLLQPLRRASRTPQIDRYRTQAFVAFSPSALALDVPTAPGAYACAVRAVLSTTGQSSRLVELGVVVVAKP